MVSWRPLLLPALLLAADAYGDNAQYSIDLTGIASGTAYTLTVDIGTLDGSGSGSSNNSFRLIADTGSSNDAVLGAGCCGDDAEVTYSCDSSSTCTASGGDTYSLAFSGATIEGQFVTDTWSSSEIDSVSKTFLVIEEQDSFYRSTYDGITGLAYEVLASPSSDPVTSFYNVLVETAGTVDAFGMLLCGIMQPMLLTGDTDFSLHAGQLLIGGSESPDGDSYFTGDMLYTPITREVWYVVTVSDVGFDDTSLGLSCDKYNDPQAILDSGTSNMAFPSDVYNALMKQIEAATLEAIPDFDSSYFDDSTSCCGEDYCDPTSNSSALLDLPSIYLTLALQSSDDSTATNEHFTVEIPPEYYWRPEMNGDDSSTACRAIGISEGTSTVLGDVFMDGLYAYHDRADGKIGLAVADNCPNDVTSTKQVYVADVSDDWCSCFSSTMQKKSTWTTYFPWGSGCFFWLWWMYVVLASVVVVLACIAVLVWWYLSSRRLKKLQEEQQQLQANGTRTRGSRLATLQSSNDGSAKGTALVPAATPSGYFDRRTKRLSSKKSIKVPPSPPPPAKAPVKDVPMMAAPKYSLMSSPRSPLSSTSSIALLSPPASSLDSSQGWKRSTKPANGFAASGRSTSSRYGTSYDKRRWGSSWEGEEL